MSNNLKIKLAMCAFWIVLIFAGVDYDSIILSVVLVSYIEYIFDEEERRKNNEF